MARSRRKLREARLFAQGLRSGRHPILVHIVPIRRCNLDCGYCNEYDDHSPPVPTNLMFRRVDQLAELGTTMIHLSGGEPLLHPEIDRIVTRIRRRGILSGILTNGYLLGPKRIRQLNAAGLDHLQISIDNLKPDSVSRKSLKVLEGKLRHLAEHAEFDVNINSVLGADLPHPEGALAIAHKANEYGFTSTVGIIHDQHGQLKPLDQRRREIFNQINSLGKSTFSAASHDEFQQNMVSGKPNHWGCHAGSRYLYVCEHGLVHYCSQQIGRPGTPLADYSKVDLEREYSVEKPCAPFCTISCVHRVAWLDKLREEPRAALEDFFPAKGSSWSTSDLPVPVRILSWLFLPDEKRKKPGVLSKLTLRILGLR